MDEDERLTAYVDGELDPPARMAFERDLARDPARQAEVARQRRLRARLAAAFDPVLDEPVPLRLSSAAQSANAPRRLWGVPHWAAMAASLLVGVLAGRAALAPSGSWTERGGAMVARGALAEALNKRPHTEDRPIRRFRDRDVDRIDRELGAMMR